MSNSNEFMLELTASLNQSKTQKQINADIRKLQKTINMLSITGTFAKGDTKKELNRWIKDLGAKLNYVKLKGKIDSRNLKNEIDKSLQNMTFKDIDALNVDTGKTKLKFRKVIADMKTFAAKTPVSVNVEMKKEKLNNDLTAFLNKNTKIQESRVLVEESERIRELIHSVNDKGTLKEATDAFQLYKSEVRATGYATKSTSDKIKSMLSHITKIGSLVGVASMAVNNFKKSLNTLKSIDTLLTEISKGNDKLSKQDLNNIGNQSFAIASKYGRTAMDYLSGIQEASRAGYENAEGIAELSVAAQGAGDMTAELANQMIIATDKAYKMNGSVSELTKVLDGMNYITNNNAVNMTELSEGMSIVGSTAASFGVSVEETTAALGTMIATTQQSGSEAARAFRAILLNIRQVSDEEEGINAEGLTKYEAACNALNVKLKETKDGVLSLRDPMEVLRELSVEYNKLEENDVRRTNLLSSVGGKLRATQLDALLRQWDTYESMIQQYADGTGSMAVEAEKTAHSWEGSLTRMQNSFDSFVNTLTNKETVIGGISFFDRLIQGAEALVNAVGEIPVALAALNAAMVFTKKDYGITQIWNKDKKKVDLQGSFLGINFTQIKNMKKHFSEAEGAIAEWNNKLHTGKANINDFKESVVENNAQLKAYLSTCSAEARASLDGYKSHLKAAGEATDALRLKTVLLNAAISLGIGFALQKIFELADNLIHSAEKCKERVDSLMSSYNSAISEANNNAKTVEDLASKYEELSKGVNSLGENVSLTTDEYAEYNSICNQIAEMFPNLIQGYTDEGNAILSLKGNVEGLRNAYKDAQQEAYNMLIVSGKDSNGNDIIKNFQNAWGSKDFFKDMFKGSLSAKEHVEIITSLYDAMLESDEAYKELYKDLIKGSGLWDNYHLTGFQGDDIKKTLKEIGFTSDLSEEDKRNIASNARSYIQTYQAEVDSALKNVQTLANAYLMTNEDYALLDEQSKNAASIIVNSINENIASGFTKPEDVGAYVAGIVDTIQDNPEVREALVGLFTTDLSTLSPKQAKELVDQYIKSIVKVLGEDKLELKIRLGFEDVDTIAHNYNAVMQKAAEKFSGVNGVRNKENWNNPDSFIDYESEKAALEAFAEENSINTQDEITFWNQCLEESETREEAMEKYLNSSFGSSGQADFSTQLTNSKESLDKFQSSVKSASDAYATLLSGSYSSSDLLDSIQEINQAISDMGGSLNWEFINSQSNSLELLGNAIDHISEKYAESILSDMGIDTDSSFGRMLAENIIQAQKAAAQLDVLNGQIDSLQSSYTNLTDIVDTYNQYGYITFDQLQNLLAMEPQYLACLIDENGQLQLNQQALQNLAEMRLYDAKVQAVNQAISELGALTHYDEKKAVEDNAQAFRNSVEDISAYNDELADTIMEAGLAAPLIRDLNTAITGAEERGASDTDIQTVLDNLNAKMKLIGSVANGGLGNILGASSSASKQAETDWKALLDKETNLLEKQLAANVITFREYTDKRRQIIEDYYRDGRIKAEEYYDALESMYANQLSLHDRAVNAVTGRLDEEIERLKEQKEALESSYQVRIDAIQEEIDALNKANDARKEQIDLEKAQYEAERARKQRVNRSFDGSQFIYEADAEAVRDAEDDLADKEFQLNISRLETQIESLRAEMENAAKSLDIQIEALESYKEKWNEIADSYGEQQDKLIAAEIMGTEWERDILNGRLDTLRSFTEQYIALQQAQADAAVNAARIKAEAGNGNTAGGNVGSVNTVGNVGNAGTGGNGNDDDDTQKYDVVYEGTAKAVRTFNTPEEAQSYANYMNKVHYKDDFMYYVKKYASGTNHAKKGLNLVGEEGTETFIDNDGNISLVTKPTLIPMEGGEVVKNAEETKELLDTSNLEPVQSEGMKKLYGYVKNLDVAKLDFHKIMQPFGNMVQIPSFHYAPVMNHFVSEPAPVVQHITLTLPNVTNNSGADYIMKELRRLPLDAYQHSHRRNR